MIAFSISLSLSFSALSLSLLSLSLSLSLSSVHVQAMARAMGVSKTEHSYEDVRLLVECKKNHENPHDMDNIVFNDFQKLFKMSYVDMQEMIRCVGKDDVANYYYYFSLNHSLFLLLL
jgi:hypothetical protein